MQKFFLVYNKNIPVKKNWGQNFLIDQNTINKIIEIVNPKKNEDILEIGPGHGALTEKILPLCKNLYAIEIDPLLCERLKNKPNIKLKIFNEDILKWEHKVANQNKIKIVGNLPYYITSPIIFKFLKYNYWNKMTIMVQKEVAQRIISEYNNKNYSRISVMCQTFCQIDYNIDVSRNSFYPKPKVDSSVITFKKTNKKIDINNYTLLIKRSFSQRRKTLKNNLKKYVDLDLIKNYKLKRPQELTVTDYINLYKKIYI
mgnify:CR=1 FL=1